MKMVQIGNFYIYDSYSEFHIFPPITFNWSFIVRKKNFRFGKTTAGNWNFYHFGPFTLMCPIDKNI